MDENAATMVERFNDRMSRSDFSARMHRLAYQVSNGRLGSEIKGVPVLLLTTMGRRSQRPRTVPLMYLPDGRRMLVVASNAADPGRPPGWWFNLQADPSASVRVVGTTHRVQARELDDAERRSWWPELTAHNPNWARFQSETDRVFPVVALELDDEEEPTWL